jgi:DNA polymerase III epsilon subunit-like protein
MKNKDWVIIDTETTGFTAPIIVVDLAAQRMRGWDPHGAPFRRLLNQNADISPEASRVHGYTREILERDGEPALEVYRAFAEYAEKLPIVSYNIQYDLEKVLKPEWKRLGVNPIGAVGFCALRLAQRLLDPVPAGNCKLQTLRQYYRLPERGAHTALGDVETVVDLMGQVLRPIAEHHGLVSWTDVRAFTEAEWFPSRIAFGKFKGRDYRDALRDESLRGWLNWLAGSSNASSAQMGKWYLRHLEESEPPNITDIILDAAVDEQKATISNVAATSPKSAIVLYVNLEVEQLQKLIAQARSRLADLETAYTKDRRAVDLTQATIFNLVRPHYQARDRLKLIVDYRKMYINSLLKNGEEEAGQVAEDYQNAKAQSDDNYEQAARDASNQKELTKDEEEELKTLWKKLVRLYHPDRFAQQPDKIETYEKLTSAINQAKEEGNIDLLREIATDPAAFILHQGWTKLDFAEEIEVKSMRKLYATLQREIIDTLDAINQLRESADFELYSLSEKRAELLQTVANNQINSITAEIAQLELEAAKLKDEIADLTDTSEMSAAQGYADLFGVRPSEAAA